LNYNPPWIYGLLKPTGNVGQRDHNNHKFLTGQFNLNKIL